VGVKRRAVIGYYGLAIALGSVIAYCDVRAPWGDDSEKLTLLLLVSFSAFLGSLQPHWPWRWAIFVGAVFPLVHLARHALGWPDSVNPPTYTTILILFPLAIGVALIGAYTGAFLGKALKPSISS
jgi:hypothetical protein